MSFTIKLRGAPHRTAIADYECPVHGRFEAEVDRDAHGDPPELSPCMVVVIEADPNGVKFGLRPDQAIGARRCGKRSEYRISAPLCKVRYFEAVSHGGWAKPERKEWQDVSKLAEGQSLGEFWDEREAIREEERKRDVVAFAREHHESVASIKD